MTYSDNEAPKIRLQVYLSHNGVCSRRKAFDKVKNGDVEVNGKIIREPSYPVKNQDKIYLKLINYFNQ